VTINTDIQPDLPTDTVSLSEEAGGWTLSTAEVALTIRAEDGRMCLKGKDGHVIMEEIEPGAKTDGDGFSAAFRLRKGERLYGLGDVNRDCTQRRGRTYTMINKCVVSYAPIPFVMSPGGRNLLPIMPQ